VAGAAIALAGAISFVGLVVPHLLQLLSGPDHRRLLPACALGGAVLLLLTDLTARTLIQPRELPLGVVTALVGGPYFLWLVHRHGRRA
jgi:iron complex transport system permease protein